MTLAILLALLPSQAGAAAEPRDLSPMLAERVAQDGMPALTAWITDGERTVARGVAGVRVRGGDAAATLGDRWHVGSCTKSMTATLFAAEVMRGVELSEDLRPLRVFTDCAEGADASWERVTMRGLLTNRAGVVGDLGAVHPDLWRRCFSGELDGPAQRRLLVRTLAARPTERPPGSAYLYSNAGFALAGAMLEARAGVPFEELMRRGLFEPLGMRHAGFGPPGESDDPAAPDAPWGHDAAGAPHPPGARLSDNPEVLSPAGRVSLTMEDWARYARFHLRGEREDSLLLPPLAVKRLHEPAAAEAEPRYAAGWIVAEIGDPPARLLAHSGSNTMWYAAIWLAPDQGFAVLVACNDGARGAAVERLVRELFLAELDSRRSV